MRKTQRFLLVWFVISTPLFWGCVSKTPSAYETQSGFGEHQDPPKKHSSARDEIPKQLETDVSNLSEQEKDILALHNRYRSKHCASPLKWSKPVAEIAQAFADKLRESGCVFQHSSSSKYGENLFFTGPSSNESGIQAVQTWYDEHRRHNFKSKRFAMNTGHFTQVVWRETTELGCGKAECNGGDIWVCNYLPAGNVQGYYRENVLPPSCH